jgi:hypothetical protein
MKKAIRLTENDLHRIVRRSVNSIMNEEWESPLDKAKKNRNDFDNVKKIDVSKFQKKPKKSKKGTFEDLPSFEKLKGLKFENRIKKSMIEAYDPYSEGDQYNELVDNLSDAYDSYISAMNAIQKFVFEHDDNAPDMYNSYAGKYGDEAKRLAQQSYSRISKLFYNDEEEY